jgi:hypothetical protein
MGHYNTVKKGDPFRPSATLENEVRRFFNGGATISGGKSKAGASNNIRISAYNSTTQEIGAYTPVAIFHNDAKDYFYIEPTTTDTGLWGITTGKISPQSSGTVVVSGIVNAMIAPGSGDFAVPNNGVLERSSSGSARVLYGGDFENDKPGMILLGGTSGSGYDGYFKLIAFPDVENGGVRVHIVNSAEFDLNGNIVIHGTNVCRVNNEYFDVPGNYIDITTIAENEIKTVYLLLERGVNNTVAFRYTAELPTEKTFETYVVLGRVSATRIWQDSYGIPQILWFSPCVGFEEPEEA